MLFMWQCSVESNCTHIIMETGTDNEIYVAVEVEMNTMKIIFGFLIRDGLEWNEQ